MIGSDRLLRELGLAAAEITGCRCDPANRHYGLCSSCEAEVLAGWWHRLYRLAYQAQVGAVVRVGGLQFRVVPGGVECVDRKVPLQSVGRERRFVRRFWRTFGVSRYRLAGAGSMAVDRAVWRARAELERAGVCCL
ncbi:MAG: hypothetical protein D6694_07220 [Gammaproteobacteria bacterium]|nr:MAG: hypothetical protein D6694_07220 [Gammaproteobacteria bacterium]